MPNDIALFSSRQFRAAAAGDVQEEPVPREVNAEDEIEWVGYRRLDNDSERVWVPAASTYIGWDENPATAIAFADTNGTAAAATIDEAIERAFLELVERDATAIWWYNRFRRPAIATDGMDLDPRLIDWLSARKRLYQVIDLTTDLHIPVVAAISAESSGGAVALGIAAGWDIVDAINAALTEMVQMEANLGLAAAQPELIADSPLANWLDRVSLAKTTVIQPLGEAERRGDPTLWNARQSPKERILAIAGAKALDVLTIDLTRDTVGVPVVRVVVPGLRPSKRRLAAGRLYEVPIELGWASNRVPEGKLNPDPLSL